MSLIRDPSRRFRAIGPLSSSFVPSPAVRRPSWARLVSSTWSRTRWPASTPWTELLAFMTRVLTEVEAQPGAE